MLGACAGSTSYPVVRPAWFGLTPAVSLVDPAVAPEEAPPRAIVPAGEQEAGPFNSVRIRQSVDQLIAYSAEMRKQGNQMWGRISGFPSQARAADWLASELDSAGIEGVKQQTYRGTGEFWQPKT